MYQVSIFNNGTETIIHYPTPDAEAPHLDKLPLKEGLSLVDSLSFSIYTNNPGYTSLFELTTKIKVIDIRDNSSRFTGRVLDAPEKMDSNGQFYKEVLCEGALSYLNDTKTRDETFLGAPAGFIQLLLNNHNSKVEDSKKIQVGDVDVTGSIAYTCSFKSTLETILEVKEKSSIDGDIRVREEDGVLYLDWLQSFTNNIIDITLGVNMKDMVKDKDITSFGSIIIPLGANNLTIKDVNGGLDYIEDTNARNVYGYIEQTVSYSDITDPTELKNKCTTDLSDYTQPKFLLEASALDLSYLTGVKAEQFVLGVNLHIVNPVMNVDDIYKTVALDLDLLKPYDPKLTIANAPVKLTSTINDLRKTTISNNGVYNGVQVGDSFGVRIVRSDNKVITTLNATEGISIENNNIKVFFVDENGNVNLVDGYIKLSNDTNIIQLDPNVGIKILNNNDAVFYVDTDGSLILKNIKILGTNSQSSTFIDSTGIHAEAIKGEVVRFDNGASLDTRGLAVRLRKTDEDYIYISETGFDYYQNGSVLFSVSSNGVYINGYKLATQSYVSSAISDAIDAHVSAYHSAP